ncbi:hypothetical protein PCL_07094 [Purpureocillium lilacinum]|uniref:Uncharacterized protein n=1 Tax=Purpureocillium lilacinum TaxID=33203 RepID=A0A2U3DSV9_PURLI|nr:hypothetical protein PCL_07094 [Purpureocillium lilacinum]
MSGRPRVDRWTDGGAADGEGAGQLVCLSNGEGRSGRHATRLRLPVCACGIVASSPSSSPSSSPTPSPGAVVAHLQSKERAALVNDAPQSRVTVRPRWQHQVPAVSDPPGIFQGLFQQHDTHSRRPEVSLLRTGRRHPVMESPPLLLRCNTIWSHVTRHPIHGSARILLFALPLREPISSLLAPPSGPKRRENAHLPAPWAFPESSSSGLAHVDPHAAACCCRFPPDKVATASTRRKAYKHLLLTLNEAASERPTLRGLTDRRSHHDAIYRYEVRDTRCKIRQLLGAICHIGGLPPVLATGSQNVTQHTLGGTLWQMRQ